MKNRVHFHIKLTWYFVFGFVFLSACTPAISAPPTFTQVSTSTPELEITNTPTLYDVSFIVFHDFNGNGQKDLEEPLLEGISIEIEDKKCSTGNDGVCSLTGISNDNKQVIIFDNRSSNDPEKLRYIFPSSYELIDIKKGLEIEVDNDPDVTIPLGQGSCVLPFPKGRQFDVLTYYDEDNREGFISNWMGESGIPEKYGGYLYSYEIRIEDGHYAIDYVFPEITPILASDAGVISFIGLDESQNNPDDYFINIETSSGLHLDYGHVTPLEELRVGQEVARGEIIGYSAKHYAYPEFDDYPYMVHIGFFPKNSNVAIDPYISLWTVLDLD